jgi:hypothetical protein
MTPHLPLIQVACSQSGPRLSSHTIHASKNGHCHVVDHYIHFTTKRLIYFGIKSISEYISLYSYELVGIYSMIHRFKLINKFPDKCNLLYFEDKNSKKIYMSLFIPPFCWYLLTSCSWCFSCFTTSSS